MDVVKSNALTSSDSDSSSSDDGDSRVEPAPKEVKSNTASSASDSSSSEDSDSSSDDDSDGDEKVEAVLPMAKPPPKRPVSALIADLRSRNFSADELQALRDCLQPVRDVISRYISFILPSFCPSIDHLCDHVKRVLFECSQVT
jgi:hypothetical protein